RCQMRGALEFRPLVARGGAPARHRQRQRRCDPKRRLHARRRLRPHPGPAYPPRPSRPPGGGMMRRICQVTLNNERYLANAGDLLLDWALLNGVELPHDCRAGMCGACRVRLVEGKVFGGHEPGDDMVHACQARIISDIAIVTEDVPDPVTVSGSV